MTLKEITAKVLGIGEERINSSLSRDNTSEWDSFNHLLLISEIEKGLNIKFTMSQVESTRNFGQLEKLVKNEKKS